MKRLLIAITILTFGLVAKGQEIIYDKSDSIFIEDIIEQVTQREHANIGDIVIDVAKQFGNSKYVGGTLDLGIDEPLFISCSKVDCTTFVELVLSISRTIAQGDNGFDDVCTNLEKIRYRNGIRNGYASRLHYISWWIDDNAAMGLLKDVTACSVSKRQMLDINFMSRHPQSYPLLKNDPAMVSTIESYELPYRNITVDYIPKQETCRSKEELGIENGDIIALATSIEGLDVSHIGFAFWQNGKLHLIHASSQEGKVIIDINTLHDYQKNKRRQIGIRVFRAI